MDHLRWLIRVALMVAAASALLDGRAQALIVEGGATINTTSAGFNSIFYNVGSISDGSIDYLGDGWALTAQHVPVTSGSTSAEFQSPGGGYTSYLAVNTLTLPGNPDLQLVRLAQSPSLPSIYQNIPTSSPAAGSVVAMVGGGESNAGPLYWNDAIANSSGLSLGASSSTPYSGTVNPIPSDTYMQDGGTVPAGTYQDAGFVGGSGRIQWGESIVTFNDLSQPYNGYNSQVFLTTFYNSVYDPPTSALWGSQLSTVNAEIAGIGPNMAQVAGGDSGGAVFVKTGAGWSLAGTLTYDYLYSPEGTSEAAYGNLSGIVDLSQYVTSIQSIINSTATWTGTSAPGVASNSWDSTTASWTNAANNGSTTFSSTGAGSAVFANANSQYAIPLDISLNSAGVQSIVVQAGVTATSITFTNTGAANGGADYSFSNAAGNSTGIGGTAGLEISGNGSGLAGAVTLIGANSFTGPVGVNVGVLNLQNSLALGNSSGTVVAFGAAIQLQTVAGASTPTTFGLTASGSTGISLALGGSGANGAGALVNLSGNNVYAGPISLRSVTTIGSFSTTANDQLSLTGGINTNGDTLTVGGPGTTTISGGVVTGGGTLFKTGSGTLTLSLAAAGSPTSNLVASASAMTLAGGVVNLAGGSATSTSYSQQFSGLTVGSGGSTLEVTAGSDPLLLSLAGTISRNVGGTVNFVLPSGTPSSTNGIATTAANQASSILGGWATAGLSDWATIAGGQIVGLSTQSTNYTNDAWAAGNNTTVTILSSPSSGSTTNSLRFNAPAANIVSLSGANVIASGGILVTPNVGAFSSTITGGTLEGAAGADLVVIQNNTSAGLAISSTIADNGSPTGLTKSGSGALTLSAANSYSGATTLNAGTLDIDNSAALGSGAFVVDGGTIDNTSIGPINTTNAETWNGSFTFQGSAALSQSGGAITLTTSPTITLASPTNALGIGGNVSGNFGIAIAGSGTLILSGSNNTFTGGVAINGGTLRVGSPQALNASAPNVVSFGATSSGTLNLNGYSVGVGGLSSASTAAIVEAAASSPTTLTISGIGIFDFAGTIENGGAGALSLIKAGSGTQILSGSDAYTGTTTVNAGVLEFAADANLPAGSSPNITVNGGGTVAAGSALDQAFLDRIASSSAGTVALAANSSSNLNFSSTTGANLQNASLGSTGNYLYTGTLIPYGTNYNLGGGGGLLTFGGTLSGANSLTVENGGYVALTANNSYSLGTTISTGTTLLIASDAAAGGSDAELGLVPSSPATNITINGGTLEATASFALNSNRGIAIGPAGGTIDVDGISTSDPNTLTYGGVIADSQGSTGGLTLTDTGTLVLSGANSYAGATNISSGTLRAGAANTIPQNSAVVLGLGGTLQLNGFSQSVGSLTGGGGVTDNSSTSATLTVGNDDTSPSAFYGVLADTTGSNTGTLALDKVGSGTLTLTGVNTYSGGTTVSAGTLATVSGGTLGPGSLRITAANGVSPLVDIGTTQSVSSLATSSVGSGTARLVVAAGMTLTSTGGLTAAGTLSIGATGSGTGSLVIAAAPSLAAGTTLQVAAGTLEFDATSGTASIGSGVTATVAPSATLQLAGTVSALSGGQLVNITNNGSLASGGSLSVTGTQQTVGTIAGTATTSAGATTYSGDTVVAAGASLTATQILQNSISIGAGATVTIAPASAVVTITAATSSEVGQIQDRIAALEQLETADSSISDGLLDEPTAAALASTLGSANPAVANPADASLSAVAANLASDITALANTENSLLASEGLPPVNASQSSDAFSSAGALPAPSAVPEPSGLLLALFVAAMAAAWAARRILLPRKLDRAK